MSRPKRKRRRGTERTQKDGGTERTQKDDKKEKEGKETKARMRIMNVQAQVVRLPSHCYAQSIAT